MGRCEELVGLLIFYYPQLGANAAYYFKNGPIAGSLNLICACQHNTNEENVPGEMLIAKLFYLKSFDDNKKYNFSAATPL